MDNVLLALHDVKGFKHIDLTQFEDKIVVVLESGVEMVYESYYDEDFEGDVHCYYDKVSGGGVESFDFQDVLDYEV
ncbi:hypothetical protein AP1_0233 [Aeromonas phage AP1]|nr:hypothetical protein AP1_0233 [Aeromonas phage AP1]